MASAQSLGPLGGSGSASCMKGGRPESLNLLEPPKSCKSTIRYKLEERQNILSHTELSPPVAGVVKYLKVTTIGGMLSAGDELMQISATEGDRFIEIKVNPADIGRLQIGLPVTIKFDAFDYSVYGTLTEQGPNNGQASTYYLAHVSLAMNER